jgi:cytochrome c-type biogenesis protein
MELTSIPLAFVAGVLSILSPCVLPMIPAIATSAAQSSKHGLWYLAGGLTLSFALGGTLLTWLLLNLQMSPEILRTGSAVVLAAFALVLLVPALSTQATFRLSTLFAGIPGVQAAANVQAAGPAGQFTVGACLGLVWLPCVGPTLGAAMALASMGQDMALAFVVMLSFGLGTGLPLVYIGYTAGLRLKRFMQTGVRARMALGVALALLAVAIFTGFDRTLERWALDLLPDWVTQI